MSSEATRSSDGDMTPSIGAFGFGLSQLLFVCTVWKCVRRGTPAPAKPWDGADSLEWTLPSPAPYHSFQRPPTIA